MTSLIPDWLSRSRMLSRVKWACRFSRSRMRCQVGSRDLDVGESRSVIMLLRCDDCVRHRASPPRKVVRVFIC